MEDKTSVILIVAFFIFHLFYFQHNVSTKSKFQTQLSLKGVDVYREQCKNDSLRSKIDSLKNQIDSLYLQIIKK